MIRNYRVLRMVYSSSDVDFSWAVGRRNSCLSSDIDNANTADGFQVKGTQKVDCSMEDRAESQTKLQTDLMVLCFWHCCFNLHLFLLCFSIDRQSCS